MDSSKENINQMKHIKKCPFCGELILKEATRCRYCHEFLAQDEHKVREEKKINPYIAGFLSLLFPGMGQFYRDKFSVGLLWFVIVIIGYITFLIPGLLLHIYCVMNAYYEGKEKRITYLFFRCAHKHLKNLYKKLPVSIQNFPKKWFAGSDNNPWKNVAVGVCFVFLIFIYGQLRSEDSGSGKIQFREEAPVVKEEPKQVKQIPKVQPDKEDEERVAKNKIKKDYAEAHTKSYNKLTESLEFMEIVNESMRAFINAYYVMDGETMLASTFVYQTALERTGESVRESRIIITNAKVPDDVRYLHAQWIDLIRDFASLPDDYDEIMPKVADGDDVAIKKAEALAKRMEELPRRAIEISHKISNNLSY